MIFASSIIQKMSSCKYLARLVGPKCQGLSIDVKCAAVMQLAKQRSMKHFGDAGAVNNLLSDALKRLQLRLKEDEYAEKDRLTVKDVSGNRSRFEGDPFEIFGDLEGDSSDRRLVRAT